MLKKCKWYNNATTATALTIDDLSCGYVDIYGNGINARTDWGYLGRQEGSIFKYFEDNLLNKYPEIRYTVFLPFGKHSAFMVDGEYPSAGLDIFKSPEFMELINYIISSGNEIAYHGHNHGSIQPTINPETWCKEYEYLGYERFKSVVSEDINKFEHNFGKKILGGRMPGYFYDQGVEAIIEESGFKWWSYDFTPFAHKHGYRGKVLDLPTNISGDYFKYSSNSIKNLLKQLRNEQRFNKFVDNGYPVVIAEHFMGARPDGKRQTPNIFDDINSLDKIFGLLRGKDIWYATCSEIAHYIDSYEHTEIKLIGNQEYRVIYNGNWKNNLLSFCSHSPQLLDVNNNASIKGSYKNGYWIYNSLRSGTYREETTARGEF